MQKKIKLISMQGNRIVFEKPKDLMITKMSLVNKLAEKIEIEFTLDVYEVTMKNIKQQLREKDRYILYVNDEKVGGTEKLVIGDGEVMIEQNLTSVCFRKQIEDLALLDYKFLLQDTIPVQKVYLQGEDLLLNIPDQTIYPTNIHGFFAVNQQTDEIKKMNFYHQDGVFYVHLLHAFQEGLWHLKILHQFNQYLLLDTVVQGDPNLINQPYFIGYAGKNEDTNIGVYFKSNELNITSLSKEEFITDIPINEKTDILINKIQVTGEVDKQLKLELTNKELILNSELISIVFVSRKRGIRVVFPRIVKIGAAIQLTISPQTMEEINNNRWDIEATFVSKNHSVSGRLQIDEGNNYKTNYLYHNMGQDSILIYSTKNNYLSAFKSLDSVVFKEKHQLKVTLSHLKKGRRGYHLAVQAKINEQIEIENIVLKLRSNDITKIIPLDHTRIKNTNINNFTVSGSFEMNWNTDFYPLYWDVFLKVVDNQGHESFVKVKGVSNKIRKKLNGDYFSNSIYANDKIIYPYETFTKDIAFIMREREYYENKGMKLKEKVAYLTYLVLKPIYFRKRDIWLGFEKFSSTAQDNGYAFFQYVDKNKLHDHFYFILRKDSADYEAASQESKNVIPFMSFKYLMLIFSSTLFVTSENKRHLYHLRARSGRIVNYIDNKKSVFLQHGVTALKQTNYFKKTKQRGNFNLVIATSEIEKKIIYENWNYELKEIAVTGFPRWDKLVDQSENRERKKIFVMPTWRSWLEGMQITDFKQTDYFRNYQDFLNSNELEQILNANNIDLVFFLHPKFKEYFSTFEFTNKNVQIKEFQDIKVNEEIMEASLLISDYSSVTWDMFYMKKPVIFFQFDFEMYNEYEGSYLDMEEELFGDRALTEKDLIELINYYAMNGFQMRDKHHLLHRAYFKYADHRNAERTYEVIKRLK